MNLTSRPSFDKNFRLVKAFRRFSFRFLFPIIFIGTPRAKALGYRICHPLEGGDFLFSQPLVLLAKQVD
ncbi:hypothetical protein SGRA_3440 [Saprospira grandis str. Lewin]|uniref:Uncharacterized protein n=1 Tax=Saprospira grandis (strain Lewin) TaxID=984262 RepID=H6L1T7_SAPGL|nr:hypothetical protein SGRA_3440 [Saprospira grandis str. Lewin]